MYSSTSRRRRRELAGSTARPIVRGRRWRPGSTWLGGVAALFTARHGSALAKSSRMITPLEQRLIRYQGGQFSDRRRNILVNAPELGGVAADRVGNTADPGQITQHYHRRPQTRIAVEHCRSGDLVDDDQH